MKSLADPESFWRYYTQCPQACIQRFRSDNGTGEYNDAIFQSILLEMGMIYEPSTPYTQHQNGVSERTIRSINDMTRSMLYDSKMPEVFWSKAVNTAVYIRNRSPSKALNLNIRQTPYECYSGNKPSLGHIRPFGCNVWVHVLDEKRTKFDSKTKRYIMLGYVVNTTRIWGFGTQKHRNKPLLQIVYLMRSPLVILMW